LSEAAVGAAIPLNMSRQSEDKVLADKNRQISSEKTSAPALEESGKNTAAAVVAVNRRRSERVDLNFPARFFIPEVDGDDCSFTAESCQVSGAGGTFQISHETAFQSNLAETLLTKLAAHPEVEIETSLNNLRGRINRVWTAEGAARSPEEKSAIVAKLIFFSVKLADNSTWLGL
jgi:hypothetical protein